MRRNWSEEANWQTFVGMRIVEREGELCGALKVGIQDHEMESKFHPGISRILEHGHVERPVTDERPFGRRDFNE